MSITILHLPDQEEFLCHENRHPELYMPQNQPGSVKWSENG